jgi:hypothetical protein
MTVSLITTASLEHVPTPTSRTGTSTQAISARQRLDFSKALKLEPAVTRPLSNEGELAESKLAGMVLGSLFQFLLPKESEGLFGNSSTAGMWGSFFSDALADSVNESGKIDLRLGRS